ncbi:unnamed protein product [Durusdinium trenchii]|uniref:Uncharacterized protein n=1 Tax=Durusdinium trenchii TaxID=1381693 RepID=A0ABP0PJG7_9DINO
MAEPMQLVRVVQPSGELAWEGEVSKKSTIKELIRTISKAGFGPPHLLALLLGSDIMQFKTMTSLEELQLKEEDCFQLVRRARSEFSNFETNTASEEGPEKLPDFLVKCVIMGPSGVGKSALVAQYCDQNYVPSYLPTIGVDFRVGQVKTNEFKLKLQLWDTAGQERFRTITLSYLRGTSSIIAVFSLEQRASLHDAVKMVNSATSHFVSADALVCLIGTHSDSESREVSEEEAFHSLLDQYLDKINSRTSDDAVEICKT